MKRFALACLLFAGCATTKSVPVSLAPPQARPSPKDYHKIHQRWTRHGQVVYDFDSALNVYVTLFGPEFRFALAERFIKLYNVPPSEQARIRAEYDAANADSIEFHVEAATHTFELSDFHRHPIWRITLIDDQGREVEPTTIVEKRERKEFIERFFPHTNEFSRSWRILFPKVYKDGTPFGADGTKSLTLRFAGPGGTVDTVWNLQG